MHTYANNPSQAGSEHHTAQCKKAKMLDTQPCLLNYRSVAEEHRSLSPALITGFPTLSWSQTLPWHTALGPNTRPRCAGGVQT